MPENKLEQIIQLNSKLNVWDYGVLINRKIETNPNKIDWSQYKTIPIKYIEKYHAGICWDFVNYQHDCFKNMNIKDDSYFFVLQNNDNTNDIVTHTFSIIYIDQQSYWFESSWFKYQGVHKVNSYKDVINILINEYDDGTSQYEVYAYNPEGLDNNLTNSEFFNLATKNLIYTNERRNLMSEYNSNEVTYFRVTYKPKSDSKYYNSNLIKASSATEARDKLRELKPDAEVIGASPVFNGSELDSYMKRGMPVLGESVDNSIDVKSYPYMFFYNCNNPTFGYDFQQYAAKLGARKVYGNYKGHHSSYFYVVPSKEVYDKLKLVARDKFTVYMQRLLPLNLDDYQNVKFIKECAITEDADTDTDTDESDDISVGALEGPKEGIEATLAMMLNLAIKDEWEAIQAYNDLSIEARANGFEELAKLSDEIGTEENKHVGQLQAALAKISPNTAAISVGEEEGNNQLSEDFKLSIRE